MTMYIIIFDINYYLAFKSVKNRLLRKISLIEWIALSSTLSLVIILSIYQNEVIYPVDLVNYLNSLSQNYKQFFYFPYWLPIFSFLDKFQLRVVWLIWGISNIICFWFAWRVFGGKMWSWFTATLFYVIFYGQISGILAAGLAAYWIALLLDNWFLIGITMLIVITKYTWGIPLVVIFAYLSGISRRTLICSLSLLVFILLLSFGFYPDWFLGYVDRVYASPPNDQASISLWRYFGPVSLFLWLLPMLLPFKKEKKVALLFFATPLAVPYFQPHDLLVWFCFPLGFFPFFVNITFLILPNLGLDGLRILFLIPLSIYLIVMFNEITLSWKNFINCFARFRK